MIRKEVLDNGIRVITESIPATHSVTIGLWVENGSRHEDAAQGGLSHFVEHMLFKGTDRRSALQIAKEIDSTGGILNAFTAREYSCYYAKILGQNLPLAVDLLADIFLNSVFDLDELEKERRVILQEIHMVEDAPDEQIHDLFCQHFWQGHPLGRPVLGSPETVGDFTREQILAFMQRRYCGRNIVITAAGNLDHDAVIDQLNKTFSGIPAGERSLPGEGPVPSGAVHRREKDLEQVHLCLGSAGLPQTHPRRFQAHLLNTLLGGSMSSRLFQSVREERGLAYSIYSYLNMHSDAGALVVYAGISPDDSLEVISLLLGELRRLGEEPIATEELSAAQEQLKGNLLLSLESTDNRMTRLAKNEIYLQRDIPVDEIVAEIEKVTLADLQDLARTLFGGNQLTLEMIGRVGKLDLTPIDLGFDFA